MAADDDSSDLSSLSSLSPVPSDDDLDEVAAPALPEAKPGILRFFPKLSEQPPKQASPPPRRRSPSPPHEYVLADNPDIAFIVMFRSRFSDAFPKSLAHFGPQELERDVVDSLPGDRVEHFLCALLGLLLNRKQDVKPGHYGRALEDAIASHKNQWPSAWEDKSPLSGGATFNSMAPAERLTLLRTLIIWSMASSETVKSLINQSYKMNRQEDDYGQPRSVQPWGSDSDRRRYFLVEGQDDTHFRVYRESNPAGMKRTWWSVAGTIDELKILAQKLEAKDGGKKAKALSQKILSVIPRFEAGEEKRRRREYRQSRKEQLKRPEPGYSLYEGRTRGKRMKYTYSDDEDVGDSDSTGNRRSSRNTGANTPADTGPVTTSSGRQIRAPPRLNMVPGEGASGSAQGNGSEYDQDGSVGLPRRPRRSAAVSHGTNGWNGSGPHNNASAGTDDDGSEAEFGDDEDDADAQIPEESEDEDEFDDDEVMIDEEDDQPRSLVVKLSVTPPRLRTILAPAGHAETLAAKPGSGGADVGVKDTSVTETAEAPTRDSISVADGTSAGAGPSAETGGQPKAVSPAQADGTGPTPAHPVPRIAATSLALRGSPEKIAARPRSPSRGATIER